jgi:serine/threonine protein kinase
MPSNERSSELLRKREELAREQLAPAADPVRDAPEVTAYSTNPTGPHVPEALAGAPAPWPAIPRYKVLSEVGRGGMGVVYRVSDLTLHRVVALKVIRSGILAGAAEVERFRREARAMAHLRHPHVVTVYDHGEYQGQPYLTMEFVGGGSLAQHLPRLGADPRRAAALMEKVAGAVHYLHQRKVIHRDLKPLNILLAENDEPFVADFGLAKFLDPGLELSQPGLVVGTLPYVAPELVNGQVQRFSAATEVWALGVILYELLAGRRPFVAREREDLVDHIVGREPPRPCSLRADLDPGLESVILIVQRNAIGLTPPARFC